MRLKDPELPNLKKIAADVTTDSLWLRHYTSHKSPALRRIIAGNTNTPADCLRQLYEECLEHPDTHELILLALAANVSTPTDILSELYQLYNNELILLALVGNPNTPIGILWCVYENIKTLDITSQNTSLNLLEKLAGNIGVPRDLLIQMSQMFPHERSCKNLFPFFRKIAENSMLPVDAFDNVMQDSVDSSLHHSIIKHPNVTKDYLINMHQSMMGYGGWRYTRRLIRDMLKERFLYSIY